MAELLFGFVSAYGLPVIAAAVFLACLAMPIPAGAVMLAAGAFAASGDLVLWQVIAVAFAAAVVGDQVGFQIGRTAGAALLPRLERSPRRARLVARARWTVQEWGGTGVFFSTWLFAQIGPWVNLLAGAAGLSRLRFTLWDTAGEAIWVSVYVSLGYVFAPRLSTLAELVGGWAGLLTAGAVTVALGALLLRAGLGLRRRAAGAGRAGGRVRGSDG